ncbi:MAG: hypothetical protein A2218_03480 [Elusimicrobia bacterium RIFOXYA2_FULL_53_38]|nr:MAG: hypothetical protein A2218_03480 [Elusimicrobia bacterium RIFOXYA2_FULL_53_38]
MMHGNKNLNIKRLLFFVLFITVVHSAAPLFSGSNIPKQDMQLITRLFEIDNTSGAGNALWSGFTPLFKPVFLNSEIGGAYILNPPFKPKDFAELKTNSGAKFYCNPGMPKKLEAKFLLDYDYDGINTMFFNYDMSDSVDQTARLIVHETFHKYQHLNFRQKPPAAPSKADPKTSSAFYIEQILLARALMSPDSWQDDFRTFIALRLKRRSWGDVPVANYEDQQEVLEGSAQYVELKSIETVGERGIIVKPADIYLAHMLLLPIEKTNEKIKYYLTGAAQMRLLTRLKVPWQPRIQNGESIFTVSLEQLNGKGAGNHSLKALLDKYGVQDMQESFSRAAIVNTNEINGILEQLGATSSRKFILITWDSNILKNSGYTSSLPMAKTAIGTLYPALVNFEIDQGAALHLVFRNTSMIKKSLNAQPIIDKNKVTVYPTQLESLLGKNEHLKIKINGKLIADISSSCAFKSIEIEGTKIYLKASRPGKISKAGEDVVVELQPQ